MKKLLIVDVAALGWETVRRRPAADGRLNFHPAATVFPALTCPVQAAFRTAATPAATGMTSNGVFLRELGRAAFWEQSAALVSGPRWWQPARAQGRKTGLLFWQQSLGEAADLILSPRPIHKHHGGMIQDCYGRPPDLYARLVAALGEFHLRHYWGPLASRHSSAWIVEAACRVMAMPDLAPDILLTYLPHLDYALQRHGPESPQADRSLNEAYAFLARLADAATQYGYDFLFFGDYAMEPVTGGPVFPNRALRAAGLLDIDVVRGMAYPDLCASPAFAMVDHQVAHVYARDAAAAQRALDVLGALPGVESALDRAAQEARGLWHPRNGDLLLVAAPGHWFAYPWWENPREAPDYAGHVDIHNKPGYDPCELFFGWPPPGISRDPVRIRGTHGRTGPGLEIAWTASWTLDSPPQTLPDLARAAAAHG